MVKFALTFYLHLTMSKSTHLIGQPLYSQITKNIDKSRVLRISKEFGGERYITLLSGEVFLGGKR